MKRILTIFLILISFCSIIYAHSGRTDKYGGHYNRSEGTYHYHSGQYAGTGEYTKPVEEGGVPIGGGLINEEEPVAYSGELVVVNDDNSRVNELEQQVERLKQEITTNEENISELEEENEEKEDVIKKLENQQNGVFVVYVIFYLASIYIAYKVGKDK